MAKRKFNNYKPPYLMIRYIEQQEEVETIKIKEPEIITIPGISAITGVLEQGINSAINKVKSIKRDDINDNFEQRSNYGYDVAESKRLNKFALGWAVVRPNLPLSPNANSVLPPGDNRKHILCKKSVLLAKENRNETINNQGVEHVFPIASPSTWRNPTSTLKNYKNKRVEKYTEKRGSSENSTITYVNGVLEDYPGDDQWKIIILDDDVPTDYVQVKYYYGDKVAPNGNEVTTITATTSSNEGLGEDPENTLRDGADQILSSNVTKINRKPLNKQKIYTLDLYEVSNYSANNKRFGFGIERFDFSGDSRKTVQQTRGKINPSNTDSVENNFYVDTWWKGPETIVLTGVVELPHAYEEQVSYITYSDLTNRDKWESFYDTMENFFSWNNNPMRINRGDKLQIIDYYKDPSSEATNLQKVNPNKHDVFDVTFKNRRFSQSVDKPGLITFELTFVVLGRSQNG